MSVNVRIKQKKLLKKPLDINDIIAISNLSYGISDQNYRLVPDKTGANTLLYDSKRLARGIEVSFEQHDIILVLSLPTGHEEIIGFYELIKKICWQLKTDQFLIDDQVKYLNEIDQLYENDCKASINALLDLKDKVNNSEYRYFQILGIYHPISLGIDELNEIDGSLFKLSDLLGRLQSLDVYYAACKVYRIQDRLAGIYITQANLPTVVPLEPYIIFNQIEGVTDWYIIIKENRMISYQDFIKSISEATYFDANHIVVTLSIAEIEEMLNKYEVLLENKTN